MPWLLCLLIIAPLVQIVFGVLRIRNKIRLSLWMNSFICLIAGIALSVLATYIDMANLPPGVNCATSSVGIVYLGFLITVIAVPFIALVFFVINYRKKKAV